mgnify:CR=1 FL=1|jgi:hypothetical protein
MNGDATRASRPELAALERAIDAALGRPIGLDENFFEAGLTSLTLVRLHAESTRGYPDPPPVTAMFGYPNVRALRRFLTEGEAAVPSRTAIDDRARRIAGARRDLRRRNRQEGGRP